MHKRTIILIFISYLIFFILTPPFQFPDEPEHFENVYWVSKLQYPYVYKQNTKNPRLFVAPLLTLYNLPEDTQNTYNILQFNSIQNSTLRKKTTESLENRALDAISSQAYHPPLYYVFASIFFRLGMIFRLDVISLFYVVRLSSACIYGAMVIIGYYILKRFFHNNNVLNNILIFFALNPLVLKSGIGITHDGLLALFLMALFWYIVTFQKTKMIGFKQLFIMAILSAGASLTKLSGLSAVLFVIFYIVIYRGFTKKNLWLIMIYCLIVYGFILPWFVFNYLRYKNPIVDNFGLIIKGGLHPQPIITACLKAVFEFRHAIMHFAGFMGWNEVYPFKWFFIGYTCLFVGLCIAGLGSFLKQYRKNAILTFTYITSLVLFLFILEIRHKIIGYPWDIQGRYIIALFLPLSIIMFWGLKKIIRKNGETISRIFFYAAVFQWYFVVFFVLIPRYYV